MYFDDDIVSLIYEHRCQWITYNGKEPVYLILGCNAYNRLLVVANGMVDKKLSDINTWNEMKIAILKGFDFGDEVGVSG